MKTILLIISLSFLKTQGQIIFPNNEYKITETSEGIYFPKKSQPVIINGISFVKMELVDIHVDTLIGYWGMLADTIYFIETQHLTDTCLQPKPMFALNQNEYQYMIISESKCDNKNNNIFEYYIISHLISKEITTEGDTIYTFMHDIKNRTLESDKINNSEGNTYPTNYAVFSFSIKNGFYNYDNNSLNCSVIEFDY